MRLDDAADVVAGAERERVAAAGELDRRAAGTDDRAAVEDADRMSALDLDAGRAGHHADVEDAAGESRSGDVDRGVAGENSLKPSILMPASSL